MPNIYMKALDSSEAPVLLTSSRSMQLPCDWHPDGDVFAFGEFSPQNEGDIWLYDLRKRSETYIGEPFLNSRFDEGSAVFSFDGRWIAYESSESGQSEIYLRPFPPPGGKVQVSNNGGQSPLWAPDTNELFYLEGNRLMSIRVSPDGTPSLPVAASGLETWEPYSYDIGQDGERILKLRESGESYERRLNVVLHWDSELKRLLPRVEKE